MYGSTSDSLRMDDANWARIDNRAERLANMHIVGRTEHVEHRGHPQVLQFTTVEGAEYYQLLPAPFSCLDSILRTTPPLSKMDLATLWFDIPVGDMQSTDCAYGPMGTLVGMNATHSLQKSPNRDGAAQSPHGLRVAGGGPATPVTH